MLSDPNPSPQKTSESSPPCISLYDEIIPGTHDSAAYTARPDLTSRTTFTPLLFPRFRRAVASVQTDFALTQTLSILDQLRAGARFLDIRVTKRPASTGDDTIWTHHGMVLCVPLSDVIDQLNAFHDEQPETTPVISVFKHTALTQQERVEVAEFVHERVKHRVFEGDATQLRQTPVSHLPPNVMAGLHGDSLDLLWGQDPWLDTFSENKKISFLSKLLESSPLRCARNNLLVLGWTVTPSVLDIVLRVASFGVLRPTVLGAATRMNNRFEAFRSDQKHRLRSSANVIFFDDFSKRLTAQVLSIRNRKF